MDERHGAAPVSQPWHPRSTARGTGVCGHVCGHGCAVTALVHVHASALCAGTALRLDGRVPARCRCAWAFSRRGCPCAHASSRTHRALPSLSRHRQAARPSPGGWPREERVPVWPVLSVGRCCPLPPAAGATRGPGLQHPRQSSFSLAWGGPLHPTQPRPGHGQGLRLAVPLHGGSKHHQRQQHPWLQTSSLCSQHPPALLSSAEEAVQQRSDPREPWPVPVWVSLTLEGQGWMDAAATAGAQEQPAVEEGRAGWGGAWPIGH